MLTDPIKKKPLPISRLHVFAFSLLDLLKANVFVLMSMPNQKWLLQEPGKHKMVKAWSMR